MVHRIPLRAGWDVTPAGRTRRFGRPRVHEATERVWLVCDALPAGAAVVVNGVGVGVADGDGRPFAADVTRLLNPRNEVAVVTAAPAAVGEVAVEIRAAGPI